VTPKRPPGRPPLGRPPLGDAPATARIELRVTPAQRLELQRVATDNRLGMSGILREAVNEFIADYGERPVFVRRKP
jgi:hypothetical protein